MIYTYRATSFDPSTHKIKNLTRKIDTNDWLQLVKTKPLYCQTGHIIERRFLPSLQNNNIRGLRECISDLYHIWRAVAGTAIFELTMFVWAGYKQGIYSAEAWATTLGFTWQAGARGLLAAVKLSTVQVIEMFNAAPKPILFRVMAPDSVEDCPYLAYEKLDGPITVYRGVSTGMSHLENAFSWSLDVEQARDFSLRNCHSKKEAPGIITAEIPKEAILCMFDYESEVVVNPRIPKLTVKKLFLQGKALKNFHKNFDSTRYVHEALQQGAISKNLLSS